MLSQATNAFHADTLTPERTGKPAVAAAVVAKTETAPKKSSDSKSVERAARSEDKTETARPAKERSQSRGKQILERFLPTKKEETKAAKEEAKAEEATETADAAPVAAATTTEPAGMYCNLILPFEHD